MIFVVTIQCRKDILMTTSMSWVLISTVLSNFFSAYTFPVALCLTLYTFPNAPLPTSCCENLRSMWYTGWMYLHNDKVFQSHFTIGFLRFAWEEIRGAFCFVGVVLIWRSKSWLQYWAFFDRWLTLVFIKAARRLVSHSLVLEYNLNCSKKAYQIIETGIICGVLEVIKIR